MKLNRRSVLGLLGLVALAPAAFAAEAQKTSG